MKLMPVGIDSDTKHQKSVVTILLKMKFHFRNDTCDEVMLFLLSHKNLNG